MSDEPVAPRPGSPEADEARLLRELSGYDAKPRAGSLSLPSGIALSVAGPCAERWAEMPGDDRVRRCTRCDRDVLDLGGLSADEINTLLAARGITTKKLHRRADGAVLTSDCDVGRPRRIALRVLAVVTTGVLVSTAAAYALHLSEADETHEPR